MILNFKQLLSLVLFMVMTTTVVNAHALSHLFDEDSSAIEHCKTCDEYTLTSQDDIYFTPSDLEQFQFQAIEIEIESYILATKEIPIITFPSGKYYNKPPPLKLV